MENCYLIVGLGNPGAEYRMTRHNVGMMLSERLAQRWRAGWSLEKKFRTRLAPAEVAGRKVLLAQPLTFMNLSGEAVGALLAYYKLPLEQLLILVDDADLPLGEIRMRGSGRSAGHHGLDSIEQRLATRNYPRLRLGIGRQAGGEREITDYVLSRFSREEMDVLEKVLGRAADQVECCLKHGIQKAMTQYNGPLETKKEAP
jgi:peptidyl-tRNA hydrolase, PTH1 family